MGLPDPDFFTVGELSERWKKLYGECTTSLIKRYITTDKLKASPVQENYQRGGGFVDAWKREPVRFVPGPITDYHITLAEVLRFEAEHPPTGQATCTAESMSDADIKEFVEKQRAAGFDDASIAHELRKKKTPRGKALSKEKIGRALHRAPETITDNSTFTHYASNLLKEN